MRPARPDDGNDPDNCNIHDNRKGITVRLLILLTLAVALRQAGWEWEQVRILYELLAAAVVMAGAPQGS
ncbi:MULTISPECIES: hypothetical protein [unclassified Streptomyces]|uniref:hypothetical protein n=1 Tax=unclassified Streptomyces TaxID=2593676 RepID=UPI000DB9A0C8|nr:MULTISPECIES: hypothetical protein [unclassified Streptomyces]MYT73796.1 hypothetical protein [Streptomyces sp. SID8367]RAJ89207.1 hypothetical protein K377_01332 [Streptomyces sp. PsTaAH-137]